MNSFVSKTKVYLEIVKQLRDMIAADGLKSGDKIPSERELSERLNAGRSSVREALRSLELLGLIETRRGEGTFLRDFRGNQLVQLLSTFILQDEKAKNDVFETKVYIEMDCLKLAIQRMNQEKLLKLKQYLMKTEEFHDDEFFYRIIQAANNHLFLRIWVILKEFYNSLDPIPNRYDVNIQDYKYLLDALANKDEAALLSAYKKLRNLSVL
ncbi:FadR family transcriptional regulator [Bacillus thermocopriae]|uniref:FadR family transcriptional regulator n=2 Tax=Neobacillus thermocopriae TaxID=1215031 RepID=A0A6B3TNB8_9BACI|nr:FadR family transcriptional regulator [Neobacillus thermocopriae]